MAKLQIGSTYISRCSDCYYDLIEFRVTSIKDGKFYFKVLGDHRCEWVIFSEDSGLSLSGEMSQRAVFKCAPIKLK